MKADDKANAVPPTPAAPPADQGVVRQLQTECERLRQRVAELEAERDQYRAEAYAWARKEFERQGLPSDEELKRMIDNEEGQPLEAFLDDIKRVTHGS